MSSIGKLMASTAAFGLIVFAPVEVSLDSEDAWVKFSQSVAFASGGSDGDGDGGDDSSGSGSGGSDDDNSGSGSGGGDDGDDNSGSGSGGGDDDDDEDNSGSGSGGDDHDDDEDVSNSGRSKPRIPGGSGCDDPGDGAEHSECSADATAPANDPDDDGNSDAQRMIVKIEVNGAGIEVRYSDRTKEEIENGVYERKNTNNRTVEKRLATGADIARLKALADGISIENVPSTGLDSRGVREAEISGDNIEITYNNGWKEEIEFGRYELKDRFNRTVVERPATDEDRARLIAALNG